MHINKLDNAAIADMIATFKYVGFVPAVFEEWLHHSRRENGPSGPFCVANRCIIYYVL